MKTILALPLSFSATKPITRMAKAVHMDVRQKAAGSILLALLLSTFSALAQSTTPVTLASHGPPYSETNFIPYEARFMKTDYQLRMGHFYTLQFSDAPADPAKWKTIATYDAPADDVWTPGAAYYVNGMFYPLGFFRMVEE